MSKKYELTEETVVASLNIVEMLCPNDALDSYPTLRDALSPVLALAKRTLDNPVSVSPVYLYHCERLVATMTRLNNKYTNRKEVI